MKGLNFLLFTASMTQLTACYSATAMHATQNGIARIPRVAFSKDLGKEQDIAVKKAISDLTSIIASKDVDALIKHENKLIGGDDRPDFPEDKYSFLFGENISQTNARKSVSQVLLNDHVVVYVEPHDTWESFKGNLYILIFYDESKVSIAGVFKDLRGDRHNYMIEYAACLIQTTDKGWLMPETPFFWETDGP